MRALIGAEEAPESRFFGGSGASRVARRSLRHEPSFNTLEHPRLLVGHGSVRRQCRAHHPAPGLQGLPACHSAQRMLWALRAGPPVTAGAWGARMSRHGAV